MSHSHTFPSSPMEGIFELRLKLFPELFDFGVDDRQTVGLIRIVTIIILMVIFSLVKRGKGANLRDNRSRPEPGRLGVLLGFFRHGSLLLAVIQNHRTVLCPDIIALSVQGGWIVRTPEDVEDVCKRNDGWIKGNLHDFCVPGDAIAYLIIRGIFYRPTGIAGHGAVHTL